MPIPQWFLAAVAGLWLVLGAAPSAAQEPAVLLHWNDLHGQVYPVRGTQGSLQGGFLALSEQVAAIRTEAGPGRVLVLDAGDWFQGTPEGSRTQGHLIIDLYNALGVDLAVVGNHDFDHGEPNLIALCERAQFPVLAANLVDARGARRSYVEGFRLLEAGGIRFGFIGLLTPDTPRIVKQEVGRGLQVADPVETCRSLLGEARAAGAECLVVLSHLGVVSERALAEALPEIDLIIGGHSHTVMLQPERTVSGTVIAQTGSKGRYLGRLEVRRATTGGRFAIAGTLLPVTGAPTAIEPGFQKVLTSYQSQVGAVDDRVAILRHDVLPGARGQLGSSPLGNWLAKVMARKAGAAIGIHNSGGIRAALLAGSVTQRELFEVSPFDNRVVICELRGSDLEELLRGSIQDPQRRLELHGLEVDYRVAESGPELVSVTHAGRPLNPEYIYQVATSDYLAGGGDGWTLFQNARISDTSWEIFEASVDELRASGGIAIDHSEHFVDVASRGVTQDAAHGTTDAMGESPWSERAISLLGMVAILGLAFLFSKARTAVRPMTVLWGVGLQVLFATIILGGRNTSFVGMFILVALIGVYLTQRWFVEGRPVAGARRWTVTVVTVLGLGAVVWSARQIEASGVPQALLWLSLAGWLLGALVGSARLVQGGFLAMISLGLARLWANGVHGRPAFDFVAGKVTGFLKLSNHGAEFLFGNLAREQHFFTDGSSWPGFGFQFAFVVLPTIIFFSAFMSVLYYFGVVQFVISAIARFMRWSMKTSGSETMSCSANIFVGQTEAPFLVKPFLEKMTVSELHAIMVGGFATIAGGVLAAYVNMGINAGHLIAASVMSAPAALVLAKLLYPETEQSETAGDVELPEVKVADNLVEAASAGVTDGLKLALNVGAMLIGFIALIAFADVVLAWVDRSIDGAWLAGTLDPRTGEYLGWVPGSLKTMLGTIFRPLAFLMGVPWAESGMVGYLMGIKIGATEFIAYGELGDLMRSGELSPRAVTIATYALCGFANFASVGIQIGGIAAICPGRRKDLAKVALRAMWGGALASWLTATVAGLLL